MLSPSQADVVHEMERWEFVQASVQLSLALCSLLLGCAYMLCFALCPSTMWQYPLSLAFWIYACDFCVTLQFVILSAKRLAVGDGAALADPSDPVSVNAPNSAFSSAPECLCALG